MKTREPHVSRPYIQDNIRTPIRTERRARSDEFLTAQSKIRKSTRRLSHIPISNRFETLARTPQEGDFWNLRNRVKHKPQYQQRSPQKRRRSIEEG
ncbi:Hypothetical predicted protein, partial [Pelobates cultripes]